jgi:23S rRNA pseudouridine955/2504/2580 synthase
MRTFTITLVDEGRTVEGMLRNAMPSVPRALLRKLVADGAVTLNGAPSPDRRLCAGDVLGLRESARVLGLLAAGPCQMDILYDDPDLLVLNKPAGLAVHPTQAKGAADLLSMAGALQSLLDHEGAYHVVNRLDRWTSGVVMMAPGVRRSAAFARLFETRQVDKRYVALVAGSPPDEGVLESPVDGHAARTTYTVLARGRGVAVLLVHPETGRRHQIRQHLAGVGHPLMGDQRYGGPPMRSAGGALLHALSMTFDHPFSGRRMTIVAPLPAHLRLAMEVSSVGPWDFHSVLPPDCGPGLTLQRTPV